MARLRPIPKILHRSWKTLDIPHHIYPKHWIDSWRDTHSTWEFCFWTDEDNERLVREHYPEFLDFYLQLAPPIKKADFCRLLYMHHAGGVYIDLDFVSLRPLDPLLSGHELVLAKLSPDNEYYQIPNAFMASCPGHDFWMKTAWDAVRAPPHECSVEAQAGPFRLQWAYHRYEPEHSVVLDHELVYAFDWIHFTDWAGGKYWREDLKQLAASLRDKPAREVAAALPRAHCATFWTHNW